MKVCSYCGTENPNNAAICENCGAHEFKNKCNNCGTVFGEGEYCPKCSVKAGQKPRVCPNCGREYYSNACPTCGYVSGGGGATERPRQATTRSYKQPSRQDKKRKTWLWVLGWLFIFPLPLTILLMRNQRMNKAVKIIILVVAWLFYLLFVFAGRRTSETSQTIPNTTPATQTSDSTTTSQEGVSEESSKVNTDVENLKQVFLALSAETKRDDIEILISVTIIFVITLFSIHIARGIYSRSASSAFTSTSTAYYGDSRAQELRHVSTSSRQHAKLSGHDNDEARRYHGL